MELEVYTPANCGVAPKGKPTVRINPKSGTISFGVGAIMKAEITVADTIAMGYSAKDKTWYFYKDPNGFKLRCKHAKWPDKDLTFNNSIVARKVLNVDGAEHPSHLYTVGLPTEENGINYFPLIG